MKQRTHSFFDISYYGHHMSIGSGLNVLLTIGLIAIALYLQHKCRSPHHVVHEYNNQASAPPAPQAAHNPNPNTSWTIQ